MIRLHDVSKVYRHRGEDVVAFQSASLEIETGDYVAIVGPSGCGKTTLLSMLGGMLSPDQGQIWFDDISVYECSVGARAALRREKIGFVFQTFNLIPYLTALENVQVPLCLTGMSMMNQESRARGLLERVGLSTRLHHKPSELSVGQQQRVALARTLANAPTVILADEPTGNLDPESRRVVLDFFDELHAEGCTIVMVTHDAAAAERARTWLHLCNGTLTSGASTFPAEAA